MAHPPGALLDFDIPAQALATALDRYAAISGWPILFQAALVTGRRSSAVQGRFAPEAALRRLLDGTGLKPERAAGGPADAYTLAEVRPQNHGAVDFQYGAWVQERLWQTLCADPRTAPGGYRVLLRFRVDGRARIHDVRLLTSSGDRARDAALRERLERTRVGRVPPAAMAQPLTMLILPAGTAGGPRCDPPRFGSEAQRDE